MVVEVVVVVDVVEELSALIPAYDASVSEAALEDK